MCVLFQKKDEILVTRVDCYRYYIMAQRQFLCIYQDQLSVEFDLPTTRARCLDEAAVRFIEFESKAKQLPTLQKKFF